MKTFTKLVHDKKEDLIVSLKIEDREKSIILTKSTEGEEVSIRIDRGQILRDGTYLENEDGKVLKVVAAFEDLSKVIAKNPHELLRLAYHLGNRHVPLEIKEDCLLFQSCHILDDMVLKLGGVIEHVSEKFEPENGAYSHSHSHDHSHEHSHEHCHEHSHEHSQDHEHTHEHKC